jgi:GTP-binding protein
MARSIPIVAIVGRTNVGKSSLFNALAGKRLAVVKDTPGITRDRNYVVVERFGAPFSLVDTGALCGEDSDALSSSVVAQTKLAIGEANIIIAVLDGKQGLHPLDFEVAALLRRCDKPVIWVMNKVDTKAATEQAPEFYQLGIEEVVPVSAAHKRGLEELVAALTLKLDLKEEEPGAETSAAIRVAILGRPNVGKSSLVNRLLGQERVVASDLPGTTRDAIHSEMLYEGQRYIFIDTAGLRRKARVQAESAERYSNLRAVRAMGDADVAVLVLDATEGAPSDQDLSIAELIHERGRGLVLVVNKWDAIAKDHRTVKAYKDAIYEQLKFVRYAPIIFTSAISGKRCVNVLQAVKEVYDQSRKRVTTGELNRVLSRAFQASPPPVWRGEPVKLFFATQVDVGPPTFVLFLNYPAGLPSSYLRYLKTVLRDNFEFKGCDLKLRLKKRTSKAQRELEGREEA